jgi:hypothetical protein
MKMSDRSPDDDDDLSEIDTTEEEFDAMWAEAEPVKLVTREEYLANRNRP